MLCGTGIALFSRATSKIRSGSILAMGSKWNQIGNIFYAAVVYSSGAPESLFFGDECYIFKEHTSVFITKMSFPRYRAASIVIDERMLWITGGRSEINDGADWGPSKTSEYVNLDESIQGKNHLYNVFVFDKISKGMLVTTEKELGEYFQRLHF